MAKTVSRNLSVCKCLVAVRAPPGLLSPCALLPPRVDSPGMEPTVARVEAILRDIPGVLSVSDVSDEQRLQVVKLEASYEHSSAIPVRNLGIALLARRDAVFVMLKDGRFRQPRAPTVYLVEHGAGEGARHIITVEGERYAVVGQEVMNGQGDYGESVIPLEGSFVIFPERRSGPQVPCSFVLPPIPFPELEREAGRLGISSIISISPSLAADAFLREAFQFSPSNALATILVGFNIQH
jgi:hypothetical protein